MLQKASKQEPKTKEPTQYLRRRRSRGDNLSDFAEHIINKPRAKTALSVPVMIGVMQAVEATGLALLGMLVYFAYAPSGDFGFYGLLVLTGVVLGNVFINFAGAHRLSAYRSTIYQAGRVLAAWTLVFIATAVVAYLFKMSEMISRGWLMGWFVSGAVFLIAFRLGLRSLIHRWSKEGKLTRRTVIVGGGEESAELIHAIRRSSGSDIELYGLFDDRTDERSPDEVAECPKLGNVSDLVAFARRTRVDLVIVSMPLAAEKRVLQMLKQLFVLPVDIRLSAHMNQLKFRPNSYSYVGAVPVFELADRPISDWNLVFKWIFDRVVAVTALVVLSPLMLATAIAVKLESKGPVFFKQKRHGFNNELIEVYKFRSMYTDMSDATASRLVTKDDPRVTRVGRIIRKTSIDELPQLFNVLKGELSVVGPRPHALQAKAANKLYNEAVEGYFARHKVKPGITGWAQVNGWRGETDTLDKLMERVNHDLYYIENWSPLLDFYIVLMTPISLLTKQENAF